jgi:hypothetical protein
MKVLHTQGVMNTRPALQGRKSVSAGVALIQAELYKGHENLEAPLVQKKQQVFEQVVATVHNCFNENFLG